MADEIAVSAISGDGTVSGDIAGVNGVVINCSTGLTGQCSETYTDGTVLSMNAVPDTGWDFVQWGGDASGTDPTVTLTAGTTPIAVTAEFAVQTFEVTVSPGANGSIEYPAGTPVSGTVTVEYGSSPTFTVVPDSGYVIEEVFVDGVSAGNGSTHTIDNVTDDSRSISATFARLVDVSLMVIEVGPALPSTFSHPSATAGDGDPSGLPGGTETGGDLTPTTLTYLENDQVIVTAADVEGWTFAAWDGTILDATANAGVDPLANTITISVPATDESLTADFNVNSWALTLGVAGDGTAVADPGPQSGSPGVTVSGSNPPEDSAVYWYGELVDVSADILPLPDGDGWYFDHWSGSAVDTGVVDPADVSQTAISFNMPDRDIGLTANFAQFTYPINIVINTTPGVWPATVAGSVVPSAQIREVVHGDSRTFDVMANEGWYIAEVMVDGSALGVNPTLDDTLTTYFLSGSPFDYIDQSHSIDVYLQMKSDYALVNAYPPSGGTISPSGAITVRVGSHPTFTITPDPGYAVQEVRTFSPHLSTPAQPESHGAISEYTFEIAASDVYWIEAWFDVDPNAAVIRFDSYGGGVLSMDGTPRSGTVALAPGSQHDIAALPDAGFDIDSMGDSWGLSSPASPSFTTPALEGGTEYWVYANFVSATLLTYMIDTWWSGGGSLSPFQPVVQEGNSQSITVTPDFGYHTADVIIDGYSVGPVSAYTFTNVQTNHWLEAYFAADTHTITPVWSPSAGGDISPASPQTLATGMNQTFEIQPTADYRIATLIVEDGSGTPISIIENGIRLSDGQRMIPGEAFDYTFIAVDQDYTIEAVFQQAFTLTVINSGTGSGVVDIGDAVPSGQNGQAALTLAAGASTAFTFYDGDTVTLSNAVADGGSRFKGYFPAATITMTADQSVDVRFNQLWTLTLTNDGTGSGTLDVSPGDPSGTGGQSGLWLGPGDSAALDFEQGDTVTLGAVADVSSNFAGWSPNVVSGQIVMNAAEAVTATFDLKTFEITALVSSGIGSISPAGTQTVSYGFDSTPFDLTPGACYHVEDVIVDGVSIGPLNTYPGFTNVTEPHTIEAVFSQNVYTIYASAGGGGSISPDGAVSVLCGTDQTFTLTPDVTAGFNIVDDVLVDDVSQGEGTTSYTFSNVTTNHTIIGIFEDHGDSCGSATTLVPNQILTASFEGTGDADVYRVDVPEPGGTLSAYTEYSGDKLDTYGTLLDGNCTVVTENDDGGHRLNFHIVQVVPPGPHFISVKSYWPDEIGTYILHVEFEVDDYGSSCNTATPIACGSAVPGRIFPAGNRDFFRLDLTEPTLLSITTTGSSDTFGYLLDSNCAEISNDNDGGADRNFLIERLLNVGTYHIVVQNHNQTATGDYTLDVQCSRSHAITASAQYGGSISPAGTVIVADGGSQTFLINAGSGNSIQDIIVDGVSVGPQDSYTFSNVTADHTITATFDLPVGACVDLADVPLDVRRHGAPANIMFVMDDSGSMDWEFMTTDDDGKFQVGNTDYEYIFDLDDRIYKTGTHASVLTGDSRLNWKSQWNGANKVYYDPAIDYEPWPTMGNADPDVPRSFPTEATPTLDLSGTFYLFNAGITPYIIDNQGDGFSISAEEVLVDNQDPNFSCTSPDDSWQSVNDLEAYGSAYLETAGTGNYTANWTPSLPADGNYRVYARWVSDGTRSSAVPFEIQHASGSSIIQVDQSQDSGQWVTLGTYYFYAGSGGSVSIDTMVGDPNLDSVCADAVRFVLTNGWDWATDPGAYKEHYYYTAENGTYTASWTPNLAAGDYQVYASWVHSDTRSQAVEYTVNHAYGSQSVTVNQRLDDGGWYLLGTYTLAAGSGSVVLNHTRSGTNDTACADAVKFVSTDDVVIDIKNAHYFLWSNTENRAYLVILDGGSIRYFAVIDDGDDYLETGELEETASPPEDVRSARGYIDERQNFANWFQYYRKRDLLTRYAIAKFITSIQGVQIGMRGINEVFIQPVLKVKVGGVDYSPTLLSGLYSYRLDAHRAATPLRRGLEEVGQYFDADDGDDGGVGPSPLASDEDGGACQQNFAIVFTDGFYNGLPPVGCGNADGDNGPPFADGNSKSLADVAMYYYENDLADSVENLVPVNPADDAVHQHVATYGVTFGVHGTLNPADYDYNNDGDADILDLRDCSGANPCPVWPEPITAHNDKRFKIDDVWHATVNGRGVFNETSNPRELLAAFLAVMQNIEARIGSAASVSVNGDELYGVLDENVHMYQSTYSSDGWTGDIKSYPVDPITGEVLVTSYNFSAAEQLENMYWNDRTIATYDSGSGGVPFRYDNLNASQQALLMADGESDDTQARLRVPYLRGDRFLELQSGGPFRNRYQKLGDIVHSSPVFEEGVLYAGGNDGMLHAFDAATGVELFAYVPNLVFENLTALTDPGYAHKFFVDLTPTIRRGVPTALNTDTTLLVGGLGKGGKGYYALDISDAASITSESQLAARVLWEFPGTVTDPVRDDLGYSYSIPAVVKSNDADRWIVIFGNGYNSVNGHAMLFIVDPADGQLLKKIDTGVGACNGLSSPVAIDIDDDHRVDFVYAGDLKGNMWKFDLTGSMSDWKIAFRDGTGTPQPLFQAKDGVNPQPITTKPDVMFHCSGQGLMVVFGTGRYLGNYDFDDQSLQSVYGIWDTSENEDPGEYHGAFERGSINELSNQPSTVSLLQQTEIQGDYFSSTGQQLRILSDNTPNWQLTTLKSDGSTCGYADGEGVEECDPNGVGVHGDPIQHAGWYFDLPMPGERVATSVMIRAGKAIVISFRPEQTPCGTGGESVVMEMDACSGGRLQQAQFDINGDGIINSDDMIVITDPNGNPIRVAPTGMYYPGRLMTPAILRSLNGEEEIKYFSTSVGNIVSMRERSIPIGITYWMEMYQ